MKRKPALVKSSSLPAKPGRRGLLTEVREMILAARQTVATTANATLTILHWQIGNRIRKDILREKRAEYGEQILSTLSKRLEAEFGRGFGRRNLFNMRWLDRYERKEGEEKPIGLILCAGRKSERIELLDLERSGIRVASYWTEILPKERKPMNRSILDALAAASMVRHEWRVNACASAIAADVASVVEATARSGLAWR